MYWIYAIIVIVLTPLIAEDTEILLCASNLSAEESAFAANLSSMHQCLFNTCFGSQERQVAMQYTRSVPSPKMAGITADMAVELALKSCRGMIRTKEIPTQSLPQDLTEQQKPKKRSPCSKSVER